MFGPEREGLRQFGVPSRSTLVRPRIDQVEADPPEMPLSRIERRKPFLHRMCTAEKPQRRIIECLDTERHAVHARRREIGKPRRFDRRGVSLQGDLQIVGDRPVPPRSVDQCRDRCGWHQRWRAPTEENRPQRPPRHQGRFVCEVLQQGVGPCLLVHRRADMAVEVAIRALRHAERPVDVERQRHRA